MHVVNMLYAIIGVLQRLYSISLQPFHNQLFPPGVSLVLLGRLLLLVRPIPFEAIEQQRDDSHDCGDFIPVIPVPMLSRTNSPAQPAAIGFAFAVLVQSDPLPCTQVLTTPFASP